MKFDGDWLSKFWRYVCERQAIYHRRHVLGQSPPWTDDPVLGKYRFTEVYREHDRGTRYVIETILPQYLESRSFEAGGGALAAHDLWFFNVAVYRKFNLPRTHALLSRLSTGMGNGAWLTDWQVTSAVKVLKGLSKVGANFQSAAYNTAAQGHNHQERAQKIHSLWNSRYYYTGLLLQANSLEEAHSIVKAVPGFGGFMASEVLQDLNYARAEILNFSEDEWAYIGPGGRRGLALLQGMGAAGNPEEPEVALRYLRDMQEESLKTTGIPWHGHKPISLTNVESALCEWAKYEFYGRVGRGKRLFNAAQAFCSDQAVG